MATHANRVNELLTGLWVAFGVAWRVALVMALALPKREPAAVTKTLVAVALALKISETELRDFLAAA